LNIADYESYLKKKLTPKRFEHSLGVMRTMEELAPIYGLDKDQAVLAGLLHDTAKELPSDQWMALIRDNEPLLHDAEIYDYDHYLHGPVGALVIQRELEIGDESVLQAIFTHGYYGSWEEFNRPLAWCLRFADILEPGRNWSNNDWLKDIVHPMREAALDGRLMDAASLLPGRLIPWYESIGLPIHPNLRRASVSR
jgi:predicted HD superfamily hydrolase involved in NAD metabolism